MPSPKREQNIEEVEKRLHDVPLDKLIPMPHDATAKRGVKLSLLERQEYEERLRRYTIEYPRYIDSFERLPPEIVDRAWDLIAGAWAGDDTLRRAATRAVTHSLDDRPAPERSQEAKASVVILLALLLGSGNEPDMITYNDFFDAVARRYSDHYVRSPARRVRDMVPSRARNAHRDLLVNFIDINKLWRFFIQHWPRIAASTLARTCAGARRTKARPPSCTSLRPHKEFWSLRDADVYYRSMEHAIAESLTVTPAAATMAAKKLEKQQDRWEKRRKTFLKWLEMRVDDGKSSAETREAAKKLTALQLVEAAVSAWHWRGKVRNLLARYDRARSFVHMYRAMWDQLDQHRRPLPSPLLIGSEFYRAVNRRYQPTHMWPSYVSNKDIKLAAAQQRDQLSVDDDPEEQGEDPVPADEDSPESYRSNWFKARHPTTGEPCALVGIDVSSSQTQIVATFLSSATLEQDTMKTGQSVAFKERLAEMAWNKHCQDNNVDGFRLRTQETPNWPDASSDYTGPGDTKLQNLCKALWMTISYGGTVQGVVRAQDNDRVTYGLGWTPENAGLFMDDINERYPSMKAFLGACRYIAEHTVKVDPKAGLVITDPFDESEFRWHPVARRDIYLDIGSGKVALSLPRGRTIKDTFERDAKYAVDAGALRRMLAPCLVHTLDAYYSSLVMLELEKRKITDFVAIHDCWLVPETVQVDGKERKGVDVVSEAFEAAAKPWYLGLRPAFEALLTCLKVPPPDGKGARAHRRHTRLIEEAYDHWKQRVCGGYVPQFLFKED